ncbi:hypothetical protein [Mucilaginibacter myungsuensis]|uniref:Uncharacterized protein n=1 Tax=Mucilaginibacter myungsuensis TaxID=649104 RepID=A0A929PXY2_9SPHI|nr:hypothetical protein [Mucilaginibacter myungsuensis]MBE9662752.1 hypothetical protein [Mucilaginibacter myungsuensis]MDN3598172.1 hypothetical protein [Mucilaginibacter myungsuensis]
MSYTEESNLQNEQNDQPSANVKHKAMEGEGMGGHQFGEDGKATPMGDDKANPSQNAGYANPYFARTAPSDEDTANNNFKAESQQGEADYDSAHGDPKVPGPQEDPEQQKVGEDTNVEEPAEQTDAPAPVEEPNDNPPAGAPDTAYEEPGLGDPQPDHGSDATESGENPDEFLK